MITSLKTPHEPSTVISENSLLKHPFYIRAANFLSIVYAGLGTIHQGIEQYLKDSSSLFGKTYDVLCNTGKTVIPLYTVYKGALLNETWKHYHPYITGSINLVAISHYIIQAKLKGVQSEVQPKVQPGIGNIHEAAQTTEKPYPIIPQIYALIVDTAKIVLPLNVIYRPLAATLLLPREINIYATIFAIFYTLIENYRQSASSAQNGEKLPIAEQTTLFYEICSIIQQATLIILPTTLSFANLLPFQLLTGVFTWTIILTAFVYAIGRRTAEISLLKDGSNISTNINAQINTESKKQPDEITVFSLVEFSKLSEIKKSEELARAARRRINLLNTTARQPNISYLTQLITRFDMNIGRGFVYMEMLNIRLRHIKTTTYRASRLITFYNHLLGQTISNKGQIAVNLLALAYGVGESYSKKDKESSKQTSRPPLSKKAE